MAGKAKQIYWAVRRVLTQPPGAMVEQWESQTGDRVLPEDHFETLVYYADGPVNLYQLRQWYEPLKALTRSEPCSRRWQTTATATTLGPVQG